MKRACACAIAAAILSMLPGCSNTSMDVSGNGGQVAVSRGGALWLADIEAEKWLKVPLDGASASSPAWSPDGRLVLFELQPASKPAPASANSSGPADAAQQQDVAQQTTEPAYAALFDTKTGKTVRLASDVGPPFAWKPDGTSFAALQEGDNGTAIGLYGTDGALQHRINLPDEANVERIAWIPGGEDLLFVASHGPTDAERTDLYRSVGDHATVIADAEKIVGLGADSEHGSMLWAKSWTDASGIHLELYRYDPIKKAVSRLEYAPEPAFVKPERGVEVTIDSVVFAPNARRMAVVVTSVRAADSDANAGDSHVTCYSAEVDGSSSALIRRSEPNTGNLYPGWSRDGRRLVIMDDSKSTPELYIYNYDGSGKRLAPFPSDEG